LSLKYPFTSLISTAGALQLRPPSVDRLASTALVEPGACDSPLKAIAA
jgi:hypothetical protein